MPRGKKITGAAKRKAMGVAAIDGATAASEATGIKRTTIIGWMKTPEFDELRQRTKAQVTEEWWAGVQLAFRRSVQLLENADDPVKAATAGAIIFDKLALTRGEATSRTESRTWTDDLGDDEKQRLRDWIDSLDDPAPVGGPGAETGA